jgi:hypothetical protein
LALRAQQSATANNRKIIKLDDIVAAIGSNPRQLEFLDEAFHNPKK